MKCPLISYWLQSVHSFKQRMPLLIAATHHHHTHICGGVTDWASVDAEGVISDDIMEGVISDDIIDCDTFSDDRGPRVVRGQACPRPAGL